MGTLIGSARRSSRSPLPPTFDYRRNPPPSTALVSQFGCGSLRAGMICRWQRRPSTTTACCRAWLTNIVVAFDALLLRS